MLNILRWNANTKMYMASTGIITPWLSQFLALVRPLWSSYWCRQYWRKNSCFTKFVRSAVHSRHCRTLSVSISSQQSLQLRWFGILNSTFTAAFGRQNSAEMDDQCYR